MPPEEVLAPTITTFENRLGKFWSKQDVKYDFEVTLSVLQPVLATHICHQNCGKTRSRSEHRGLRPAFRKHLSTLYP